jgi:predicted Rossmann fold flavoprotein
MRTSDAPERAEIAVVGAGAAGLMAAICAARAAPQARVVALDGARTLGAKILVAGGGRCNVTHDTVDASAFAGGSRHAISRVLRQFDVPETIRFFAELGIPLKREETGKLFPVSNRARTVLEGLLDGARAAGVEVYHPRRVQAIAREGDDFRLSGDWGALTAQRVILATGGKSLPKSGSDGGGYALAQALGHSLTARIFPALVPLLLPEGHFLRGLSGVSIDAALSVHGAGGKRLHALAGAVLFTHFGLSGPAVLDISRYWLDARAADRGAALAMNALPALTPDQLDADLRALGRATPLTYLSRKLPDRLARALVIKAGLDPALPASQLPRDARRALVTAVTALPLPVTGDRGFTYAEVTAGGVPLNELHPDTLESRCCPGLYLCGEICDVDGRIGGYNFQWAWSSGYAAGRAAAHSITPHSR